MSDEFQRLQERLRQFAEDRDWEQFHTPKNLAMALAAEAGELLEVFQWLTPEEAVAVADDGDLLRAASDELADIGIYLLRIADVLGVDLAEAIDAKVARNAARYPVERVRGRADVRPVDPS